MQAADGTASYRQQYRATLALALWTLAWLVTLAAARFGPALWGARPAASWVAIGANLLVGIGWILAIARYLRAIDDLWRKINSDALATTLGIGWVAGFGYFVAEAEGLVTTEVSSGLFPALLGVVYMVAVLVGWVRYR